MAAADINSEQSRLLKADAVQQHCSSSREPSFFFFKKKKRFEQPSSKGTIDGAATTGATMTLSSTSTDEHLPWSPWRATIASREHWGSRAGASFCKDATRRDAIAWRGMLASPKSHGTHMIPTPTMPASSPSPSPSPHRHADRGAGRRNDPQPAPGKGGEDHEPQRYDGGVEIGIHACEHET